MFYNLWLQMNIKQLWTDKCYKNALLYHSHYNYRLVVVVLRRGSVAQSKDVTKRLYFLVFCGAELAFISCVGFNLR